MVKTLDEIPGKQSSLQEIANIDYPAGTQFVLPQNMETNNAHTFTAIAFAVREPGRPAGNYNIIPPSGQPRNDKTIHMVSETVIIRGMIHDYGGSNFRLKTAITRVYRSSHC